MSRSDQYIGLTKEANNFINDLPKDFLTKEYIDICESAFNNSPVPGSVWIYNNPASIYIYKYKEVLQLEIWSSGPMYFTCLKSEVINKLAGNKIVSSSNMFEWKEGKLNQEYEYNYELGLYNI